KGRLDFALQGKKLSGAWHLVRMRGRPGEKKANWLLIKGQDDAARSPDEPDILEEEPRSVVSGRSIEEIAQGKGKTRVWHSNRSVAENAKEGRATRAPRAIAPRQSRRAHSAAVMQKTAANQKQPRSSKPPQAP